MPADDKLKAFSSKHISRVLKVRLLVVFLQVRLGYMYNFSLGMLFAVAAMAYTYVFVPESLPLREARLAKQKSTNCQEESKGNFVIDTCVYQLENVFDTYSIRLFRFHVL